MKTLSGIANPLPYEIRERVSEVLNGILAELTDLHAQCKHAHWNVKGQHFYTLHKLFNKLAKTVGKRIDPVAERITALGGFAEGTIRMAAARSSLPELPNGETGDDLGYVVALTERFAHGAALVGRGIEHAGEFHDQDTVDMLTKVSRNLEKGLWLLEAHLQHRQ